MKKLMAILVLSLNTFSMDHHPDSPKCKECGQMVVINMNVTRNGETQTQTTVYQLTNETACIAIKKDKKKLGIYGFILLAISSAVGLTVNYSKSNNCE